MPQHDLQLPTRTTELTASNLSRGNEVYLKDMSYLSNDRNLWRFWNLNISSHSAQMATNTLRIKTMNSRPTRPVECLVEASWSCSRFGTLDRGRISNNVPFNYPTSWDRSTEHEEYAHKSNKSTNNTRFFPLARGKESIFQIPRSSANPSNRKRKCFCCKFSRHQIKDCQKKLEDEEEYAHQSKNAQDHGWQIQLLLCWCSS